MKDYKRLTKRNADGSVCYASPLTSSFIGAIYEEQKQRDGEILRRLAELEDKIESGELCHRKETVREILKEMVKRLNNNHMQDLGDYKGLMGFLKIKYGVDLEDEE